MSRAPSPQSSTSPIRGLALTGSALIGVAMFCWQLAVMSRAAWRAVLVPGPADPAQALAALAGSVAFILTLWLFGALALSLLAVIGPSSSALSRVTARGARLIAPVMLRNAVAALLGVAIAASPTMADAAPSGFRGGAGQPAGPPRPVPISQVDEDFRRLGHHQ
jgi:hypothetical protein